MATDGNLSALSPLHSAGGGGIRNEDPPEGGERKRKGGGRSGDFDRFLAYAAKVERGESLPLRTWLDLAEAWRITAALRQCRGNRSAAARALGIGRRTLYAKMEKLGITPTWTLKEGG